jgi:type I restriction enzyme, R subunit
MRDYSEDALIEQPAIQLFHDLRWQTINAFEEQYGPGGTLGRETRAEVVLVPRLRAALAKLNPALPADAIELAILELTRDRSALNPTHANREVYRLLKDGIKVTVRNEDDEETAETARVVDWDSPYNNDLLLVSQLWVAGEMYTRRADLVGFVNGLPLVFVELKASHRRLEAAYRDNLRDYKDTIPQLFWYNALIVLSNGSQTRIGSITAGWEHFFEWKKITSEGEQGRISLETAIRGVCEPGRLLDIIENFILYSDAGGGLIKIIAKNHQYLGVNNAIVAVLDIRHNQGRLGVFWHTQGSGKSVSMVFFSQKVLRKIPGNWTFLIVTDRQELDDQIYKTFAAAGAVTEEEVHAESGEDLKRLLREDHRNVFTLIQKFRTERGETYPTLSERADIIVITDEAHRSQYDAFALNMRNALPNAAFIAFTGTPLIVGEEKTREVFGDYVSIYNFRQSIEDGTTVPLYYENRIPELQLTNPRLNEDIEQLIEGADLDEDQQQRLEREFAREYHLITRDDRLERIAEDIVAHFMSRGQPGKAMVVLIDKATAVRMYDKVRTYWQRYLDGMRTRLATLEGNAPLLYPVRGGRREGATHDVAAPGATRAEPDEATVAEIEELRAKIAYMEETDMAVVVSQAQNEIADFRAKGLDIAIHRLRIVTEDLETKFKDPTDPLRIVFVCAMWMTGFDVPSLSTLYLDKPMRNHTLMQTIARANRVFGDKTNGLIVDYVGVFRDLQKALAIYATPRGGGEEEDTPVKDKAELVAQLGLAIEEASAFCRLHGVDIPAIMAAAGYDRVALLDEAVDALMVNDEVRRRYIAMAATVAQVYRAILPDPAAANYTPATALFAVLADKVRSYLPEPDITGVMAGIEKLLDTSIAAEGYVIQGVAEAGQPNEPIRPIDLSQIDFEALRRRFEQGRRHIEAQRLRGAINVKLQRMVRLNKARTDYLERFQRLIEEYNAGSMNVEVFFDQLMAMAQELTEEERRALAEHLSEEELAIVDLLTRPGPPLDDKQREQVKRTARDLLDTLKREKLVLDWKKRQLTRAGVLTTIRDVLDRELPSTYTKDAFDEKCAQVYQHIYDAYADGSHSIYAA